MKLIARAPIERGLPGGRHARPGDAFDLDDVELARELVASGECDALEGAALVAAVDATTDAAPAEAPRRRGRPKA